jgi:hypothetical protein
MLIDALITKKYIQKDIEVLITLKKVVSCNGMNEFSFFIKIIKVI